jgi:hypothetical protein
MFALSEDGDNASVDMLVGDIYGQDYSKRFYDPLEVLVKIDVKDLNIRWLRCLVATRQGHSTSVGGSDILRCSHSRLPEIATVRSRTQP